MQHTTRTSHTSTTTGSSSLHTRYMTHDTGITQQPTQWPRLSQCSQRYSKHSSPTQHNPTSVSAARDHYAIIRAHTLDATPTSQTSLRSTTSLHCHLSHLRNSTLRIIHTQAAQPLDDSTVQHHAYPATTHTTAHALTALVTARPIPARLHHLPCQ